MWTTIQNLLICLMVSYQIKAGFGYLATSGPSMLHMTTRRPLVNARNSLQQLSGPQISRSSNMSPMLKDSTAAGNPLLSRSSTSLEMGFNLPPGGGGNKPNPLGDILPGIVTLVGVALFFASPLGGIFFAVTNSLLALAFITPLVLYVVFQIWAKLNTIEGTCPSCSAPVVVLKNGMEGMEATPCLNCGSMVRPTQDGSGVELCNVAPDFNDMGADSDSGDNIFDFLNSFGQDDQVTPTTTMQGPKSGKVEDRVQKAKRESTIIDVDVSKDD